MRSFDRRARVTGGLLLALLAGCDEPVVTGPAQRPARPAPVRPEPAAGEAAPAGGEPASTTEPGASLPGLPAYDDSDFVELEVTNRDPFRSFASLFVTRNIPQRVQRRVILDSIAVEEMRLVAIITGLPQPRAMVLDRQNVGWVLKRGDYIGRAEFVQAGGPEGTPVPLNWRVDRIRDNEVVLTREDPTAPGRPPLTRVLPLRQEQDTNPLLEQIDRAISGEGGDAPSR